jgi:hypothetical protein
MTSITRRALGALLLGAVALSANQASAWTRPGHMLTAAIAFDDLSAHDHAALETIGALLDKHPDHGPFQVAAERSTGDERILRLMMQCARWPDDQRQTPFDHPTWHYYATGTAGTGAPKPLPPEAAGSGQASEALRLNFLEASDPLAPVADRALALCWVMHIAGDIHQPLHTSTLFSSAYPQGDAEGTRQYVRDPETGTVVSLHWYWDDRVNKSADPATIHALAGDLEKRIPRGSLAELNAGSRFDFAHWAAESHALAVSRAYPATLKTGMANDATAPAVPDDYSRLVKDVSERRMTLAGYRLADLLRAIAAVPVPKDVK